MHIRVLVRTCISIHPRSSLSKGHNMSESGSFEKSAIRFCLFALLALTMTSLGARAQALPVGSGVTVFSPPQNLSNDSGQSWQQQVAVDCKGNIDVVWWDDSQDTGLFSSVAREMEELLFSSAGCFKGSTRHDSAEPCRGFRGKYLCRLGRLEQP
jgi:hypothetical protein